MKKSAFFSEEFENILSRYLSRIKSVRSANECLNAVCMACDTLQKDFLDISMDDAALYFDSMMQRVYSHTLAPLTVRTRKLLLSGVATYIEENCEELDFKDPFKRIYVGIDSENVARVDKIPSLEEVDSILSCVENDMYYLIISLAFRVALSASEIVALRDNWFQAVDGRMYLTIPSGVRGYKGRTIMLPDDLAKLVLDYLASYSKRDADGRFLFNRHGNPVTIRNIDSAIRKAVEESGVSSDYSLKDFRTRSILDMVKAVDERGEEIETVAQFVGISSFRLSAFVGKTNVVGECPANLVNFRMKGRCEE